MVPVACRAQLRGDVATPERGRLWRSLLEIVLAGWYAASSWSCTWATSGCRAHRPVTGMQQQGGACSPDEAADVIQSLLHASAKPVGSDSLVHAGSVFDVALHPHDSGVVATASDDETAAVWHVVPGARGDSPPSEGGLQLSRRLRGHTEPVLRVSWNADGSLLASSSADGTVRLWREEDREGPSAVLDDHPEEVYAIEWRAHAAHQAVTVSGEYLYLWDVEKEHIVARSSPIPLESATVPERWRPGYVFGCSQSADGQLFAGACSDGGLRLWGCEGGAWQAQGSIHAHDGMAVACSFLDSFTVVSASRAGTVAVSDVRTMRQLCVLDVGVTVHSLSLCGGRLPGWVVLACGDGALRFLEPLSGEVVEAPCAAGAVPLSAVLSDDGRMLVAGCAAVVREGFCPTEDELALELKGLRIDRDDAPRAEVSNRGEAESEAGGGCEGGGGDTAGCGHACPASSCTDCSGHEHGHDGCHDHDHAGCAHGDNDEDAVWRRNRHKWGPIMLFQAAAA